MKIYEHEIYGMSRVGYIGELEVYVNTDDAGNLPHFHLRDSSDWDRFHTCILIERAEYFLHQGKEDILNSKQRKELQEFMESPVLLKKYKHMVATNWDLICLLWDLNNSHVTISEDAIMPNYLMLR